MPKYEVEIRGARYEIEAPDEQSLRQAVDSLARQPQHFELEPPQGDGVDGGILRDVLPSLGSGLRRGAETLAGFAGDINQLAGAGAEWAAGKVGAGPETAETIGHVVRRFHPTGHAQTSEEIQRRVTDPMLGDALTHQPQTTMGEYAQAVGEFLPAAAIGPGGALRKLATQAVLPALGSESAGQLTEGTALEGPARVGGALAGALAPAAIARAVTPNPASATRIKAAETLKREGVPVTAGQRTGNAELLRREGGSRGAQQFAEGQAEAYTSAILKRAGINANRATPDVVDRAFTRIGGQFDDLAAKTEVPFTTSLQDDILRVVDDYQAGSAHVAPGVERIMNRAAELAAGNGGKLSGEAYKNLRSEMGRLAKAADPATKQAMRDIQSVLDDAVGKVMPTEFMGQWQKVRREYRNLLVVEDAATRAGEAAAAGFLTPSAVRNAVVRQGRRGYARGQGDLATLARSGAQVLKDIPVSESLNSTLKSIGRSARGGGVGAAIGTLAGGPGVGTAIGGGIGAALPSISNLARLSGPVQGYLGNQMAAGLPRVPGILEVGGIPLLEGLLQDRRKKEPHR